MPPGQHHAHRLLERDGARQPLHAARTRREADARLGQREPGLVGGDDEVAGERDLEAAAHGDAVDGGDHGLVEVVAVGEAAEALGRGMRPPARLGAQLRVILEVVAGRERLVAGAGDDRDPQLGIGGELVEDVRQLLVRHRVQRVVDLGAVDGDDQQVAVDLGLAVLAVFLAHGCLLRARPAWCVGRLPNTAREHARRQALSGVSSRPYSAADASSQCQKLSANPRATAIS